MKKGSALTQREYDERAKRNAYHAHCPAHDGLATGISNRPDEVDALKRFFENQLARVRMRIQWHGFRYRRRMTEHTHGMEFACERRGYSYGGGPSLRGKQSRGGDNAQPTPE